jgi:hypothetical protein
VFIAGVAVVVLAMLSGCGGGKGSVSGKVTYKGKILKGGNVIFEGDKTYSTRIKEDGTYESPPMSTGTYKVCVDTSNLKPRNAGYNDKNVSKSTTEAPKVDADANIPEGYTPSNPKNSSFYKGSENYTAIPSKYTKADQTPLSYTVTGGSQPYDIELQ